MAYRIEFPPEIQDEIRGWGLPVAVVREFYSRLLDDAQSPSFLGRLYCIDDLRYEHVIHVDESSRIRATFTLRMDLNPGGLFRVVQCSAFRSDNGRNMLWSSP